MVVTKKLQDSLWIRSGSPSRRVGRSNRCRACGGASRCGACASRGLRRRRVVRGAVRRGTEQRCAQRLGAVAAAQTTLFHLGVLDTAPRKNAPDRSAERAAQWAAVPSRLAATLTGYIA